MMKLRILRFCCVAILMIALLALAVISRLMMEQERKASASAPSTFAVTPSQQSTVETTGVSVEPDTTISSNLPVFGTIPSEPLTTEPTTTEPTTTEPPTTAPPTTEPTTTQPPTTVPPTTQPENVFPELTAKTAFVYDSRTGEYLYINADKNKAVYPASITKLFTTYVALRYLPLDTKLTVGDELDDLAADLSFAGLKKGDTLTVEAVAKGALIPSGCDVSYVLAAAAGRAILQNEKAATKDAIQAFMGKVNEMASQMGMTNTNFVTPDGDHHNNHKISLNSMVIIAKSCMEDTFLSQVVAMSSAKVTVKDAQGKDRVLTLKNTNENLNPQSTHYSKTCIGLKTGYTSKAGACLLSAFEVEGGYLLIGVFGCPTWDSRFPDTLALLKYYSK